MSLWHAFTSWVCNLFLYVVCPFWRLTLNDHQLDFHGYPVFINSRLYHTFLTMVESQNQIYHNTILIDVDKLQRSSTVSYNFHKYLSRLAGHMDFIIVCNNEFVQENWYDKMYQLYYCKGYIDLRYNIRESITQQDKIQTDLNNYVHNKMELNDKFYTTLKLITDTKTYAYSIQEAIEHQQIKEFCQTHCCGSLQ